MTLTFDTLAYANKLKAVGVPDKQAEVHAEAIAELVVDHLVTKQDLKEGLSELELRMVIKLGGMIIGSMTLLIVLLKLFHL